MVGLNEFKEWINKEIKGDRRVTRREWIISIVYALSLEHLSA